MMRWIVKTSLQYRYLVVFLAALLMFFGIAQLREMPVDVFPEFAPPLVEIQTEGIGMSTTEVEELITVQLEQTLNGTPGLDVMRSKSVQGLSSIRLIFKPGTDSMLARQLVQERLAVAIPNLPTSAGMPWMLQPLSATSRVMKIGLSSTSMSMLDLSMTAYWKIRRLRIYMAFKPIMPLMKVAVQMPRIHQVMEITVLPQTSMPLLSTWRVK